MPMNWPYLHILINHFPIILTVVGSGVLALALITRRRWLWLYSVATLTLAGVSVYPVVYTGHRAARALHDTWYVVRSMVAEHSSAASWALPAILLMGAVSAYTWWRLLRRETTGIPPVWLRVTLAVVAALGLSIITRTAYLGGKIVHDSPKLLNPPGVASPQSTGG